MNQSLKQGAGALLKNSAKLRTKIEARASTLGIPMSVWKPVVELFLHDASHSGLEWTIKRFKSLVSDFTQWLATGNRSPVPWVRTSSSGKFCYSGPIGQLERWCKSTDKKVRALQLLKMYSYFVSPSVTKTQITKFLSGVSAEGSRSDYSFAFPSYDTAIRDDLYRSFGRRVHSTFNRVELPSIFGSVGSPTKSGPIPEKSIPEPESFVDSVRFLSDFSDGFHHYCRYKEIYKVVLGDYLDFRVRSTYGVDLRERGWHVGRIGLIQEPGYKLRAVANPGRVFQFALHKFGRALYSGLQSLPWDCTFDQSKGHKVIQNALSHNRTAFCVDLRNATDYFPMHLQKQLLLNSVEADSVYLKHFRLWEEISLSPWRMRDQFIQWKTGQPLGLYPSFAAFAASHGFMLYELNGRKWDESWYVLGDDICILNEPLYRKYVELLSNMGCPTSPEKTLVSSEVAEFAGNLIFKDKVVPVIKWRDISDDNFVDIARYLGPKSLSIFRPRQRKVLEKILSFVDEGPGWNPKGIPLEDRIAAEERFKRLSSDTIPELQTSRYPEMWRDVFSSQFFTHVRDMFGQGFLSHVGLGDDLDQRSRELVTQVLGSQFSDMYHVLASNAQVVSGITRLPSRARGVYAGRRTQLEVLESKLKSSF